MRQPGSWKTAVRKSHRLSTKTSVSMKGGLGDSKDRYRLTANQDGCYLSSAPNQDVRSAAREWSRRALQAGMSSGNSPAAPQTINAGPARDPAMPLLGTPTPDQRVSRSCRHAHVHSSLTPGAELCTRVCGEVGGRAQAPHPHSRRNPATTGMNPEDSRFSERSQPQRDAHCGSPLVLAT